MKKGVLRLLDFLIVIAFIALLYILIEPQYRQSKITTSRRKLQSNMFAVKAGLERYIAFNDGNITDSIPLIFNNMKNLEVPINPFKQEKMTEEDIMKFRYDLPSDIEDRSPDGPNGKVEGEPGQVALGFFYPIGKDTMPTKYGIIGIDRDGKPLVIKEGEKERVFLVEQ